MNHEIDLSKYQIRTDLVLETIENQIENNGFEKTTYKENDIQVTQVTLDEKSAHMIDKKVGDYITIEFQDITDFHNRENVKTIVTKELQSLLKKANVKKEDRCLVIGLGNKKSTPDALGPCTIDHILVTNHLFLLDTPEDGFRQVCAISPGVMGETGIETSDIIYSVIQTTKPDFVIAIDALASQAISRVNKTIQMSNTGIHPGSGIGNNRKEISQETLGIPVIAIGVPTVVDAVTIVSDTIKYLHKFYAFQKDFINHPMRKMIYDGHINYLNKEVELNENDKKELFGIMGHFTEEETKTLINEVLTPIGYNLMITPKEIDFVIQHLSDIIGNGINQALHEKVTH